MKPVLSIKCAASFFRVATSFSTWFTGPISSWHHLENTLPTSKHQVRRFFGKELTLNYRPNERVTHNSGLVLYHSWFTSNWSICANGNDGFFCFVLFFLSFSNYNENHGSWAKWKNFTFLSARRNIFKFLLVVMKLGSLLCGKTLSQVSCFTSTPSYLLDGRRKRTQTAN